MRLINKLDLNMLELNPIFNQIDDLQTRIDALRGYL